MRDVCQPCVGTWREKGPAEAIAQCHADGKVCAEFQSTSEDVEGRPDTCALALWIRSLEQTRMGARERGLLAADMTGAEPLGATEPLTTVQGWLENRKRVNLLVLAGTKGVGKTLAACYALSRYSRGMPNGRYILANAVLDPDTKLRHIASVPLLVIDQLGNEYVANREWGDARFTELLDRRYSDLLPTILVGNVNEEGFRLRYGSLVMDRLAGDGLFRSFQARSLRGGR